MTKKELTHIYTLIIDMATIEVNLQRSTDVHQEELFAKSLPLTSDLKRLPILLGCSMQILNSPDMFGEISTGTVGGLTVTAMLLNGNYEADDFDTFAELLADERARTDILGIAQGYWGLLSGEPVIDIQNYAWDLEGEVVLFDTISLLIFAQTDVNVTGSSISARPVGLVQIEIDWKPMNVKDVQEFIMEHIYARQGD